MKHEILESSEYKLIRSKNFNLCFNKHSGETLTWGHDFKDDPDWCPFGPIIADIEVSTVCNRGCKACYKSNTSSGENMSLSTFSRVLKKLPKTVTQIAFGIGDLESNPDLFKIFDLSRKHGVVPNVTINGRNLTEELAWKLSSLCGAVAVSHYEDDECFNAVKLLCDSGLKQVNIHQVLCWETYDDCCSLLRKVKNDPRLKGLGAIVFLWLKPKGDRNTYHQLEDSKLYQHLIDRSFAEGVSIGFDSCGASSFAKAVKDRSDYNTLSKLIESCESTLFSAYINVHGMFFPCSFCEGEKDHAGLNVLESKNFIDDIWNHQQTINFRNKLLRTKDSLGCRNCPQFKIGV